MIFQEMLDSVIQLNQLIQGFLKTASVVLVNVKGIFPVDSLVAVINRVAFVLSVVRFRFSLLISESDILI